ncbi:MAG TPA: glycosyltransferase [Gammaproteobacteria bacterium]|nr:glycosyltransferase [Gammaproteobacteria bacterium]
MTAPNRKTILFVNHSLAMGGIERMICDFAESLPEDEFDVHAAVFEAGGVLEQRLEAAGIAVYHLDKKEGLDYGLVRRLAALSRMIGADVIHSNNYSAWLYSVLATRLGGAGVCVHTEHSSVEGSERRRYLLEWLLSHGTHSVIAVSEKVRDNLARRARISERRLHYIPNGIDTARFAPLPEVREAVRSRFGLAAGDVVVGAVGRLVPVKNHRLLVEAFARAHRHCDRLRLLLVGEGPEREAIEASIAEQGMGGQVILAGERQDIDSVLNAMDIYVLSSFSEGMSLSLLEAMSAGLPVVATAVGGNVDLVDDGVSGLLVPSADAASMQQALVDLAADAEMRTRMGQASREIVLARYSRDAMIGRYSDIYRRATARHDP